MSQFPVIGDEISGTVSQSRLRGSGLALAVGAALALWGGLGVAEAAQAAMNGIWNVPRRRYPSFSRRPRPGLAGHPRGGLLLASVVWGSRPPPTPPGRAGRGGRLDAGEHAAVPGRVPGADGPQRGPAVAAARGAAALAWALLQWLGGWYVDRQLSRASATYGAFALVIGLLSWLYLASTVTLLAAEVNVSAPGSQPRSLAPSCPGRGR